MYFRRHGSNCFWKLFYEIVLSFKIHVFYTFLQPVNGSLVIEGTYFRIPLVQRVHRGKHLKFIGNVGVHIGLVPDINPAEFYYISIVVIYLFPKLCKVSRVLVGRIEYLNQPYTITLFYLIMVVMGS